MITEQQAKQIIKESLTEDIFSLRHTERTSIYKAIGRVLAEDIFSDTDIPLADKSAMDGFACKTEDLFKELQIIETIAAGKKPLKTIEKGQCAKIMTGAVLPQGADCVIMIEDTVLTQTGKIKFIKTQTKKNIRYKGEDIKKDVIVLKKGTLLKAPDIGVLAQAGIINPLVYQLINIGIISTGDEIIEPQNIPQQHQVRNINSYLLAAALSKTPADYKYYGIIKDQPQELEAAILKSMSDCNITLISGGVSEGDYDYIPTVLQKAGVEILFKSVLMQPGRPLLFGKLKDKFCFGLPGNPVSSFLQFELLVKDLIYLLAGTQHQPVLLKLPIEQDFARRRSDRLAFLPVLITEAQTIKPLSYHGSADIYAYTKANAIICLEPGTENIKKGELVNVRLL